MNPLAQISLLADSLALARPPEEHDGVRLENTYPHLLIMKLRRRFSERAPVIHECGKRARTIEDVLECWPEEVLIRGVDLAIVHVGIADCAPRVFSKFQHRLVENIHLAFVQKTILRFVSKHRRKLIQLRPNCRYVNHKTFHERVFTLATWAKRTGAAKVLFINIVCPPDEMELRSPGFHKSVKTYNDLLEKYVDNEQIFHLDLNAQVVKKGIADCTTDGIHLSEEGHEILSLALTEKVVEILGLEAA